MFQLTDRAAQRMKAALSEVENSEGVCFRLGVTEDKLRMVVDQERPGDTTVEHEGEVVLVMDSVAAGRLDNHKLDFEEDTSSLVLREADSGQD